MRPSPAKTTAMARGVRAACASTHSWTARGAVGAAVSFHSYEHLVALGGASERQLGECGASGSTTDGAEQRLVAARSKRRIVVCVEEVGVVLERGRAAPRRPRARRSSGRTSPSRRLSPGAAPVARSPAEHRRPRLVLQHAHDLEERVAAHVALGLHLLDQLLEGQVLVGVGAQRHLAHPRQQLAEGRVAARGRCAAPGCWRRSRSPPRPRARLRLAIGEPTGTSACPV